MVRIFKGFFMPLLVFSREQYPSRSVQTNAKGIPLGQLNAGYLTTDLNDDHKTSNEVVGILTLAEAILISNTNNGARIFKGFFRQNFGQC